MQLSEHFTLAEFVASATAQERGIDNTPSGEIVRHLTTTAQGFEQVRALLGHAMHINSGYRCPELNKAVRGVWNSAHLTGYAGDFVCPDFGTPLQIVEAITKSGIKFDQRIQEGTWVHLSFDPELRQQVFTASFDTHGDATYTPGVA
jgi:hypothetical protein